MKLITEMNDDVQFLVEQQNGTKSYSISGIFMQADKLNKNNRIYEMKVLEPKVSDYISTFVENNRAFGELNHPQGPTVNLDRVSHLVKELKCEGSNFVGTAKVMNTPMGKIVQSLMDEGARLGVSTRGMGSLKTHNGVNMVQPDFMLSAIDIVADPSAPDAFVDGIMEGKEWIWENGILKEKTISDYKNEISKTSSRQMKNKFTRLFEDFLRKI